MDRDEVVGDRESGEEVRGGGNKAGERTREVVSRSHGPCVTSVAKRRTATSVSRCRRGKDDS